MANNFVYIHFILAVFHKLLIYYYKYINFIGDYNDKMYVLQCSAAFEVVFNIMVTKFQTIMGVKIYINEIILLQQDNLLTNNDWFLNYNEGWKFSTTCPNSAHIFGQLQESFKAFNMIRAFTFPIPKY